MPKKLLNLFLLLFGLIASSAANAETHALLMFIGDYRAGIPKLEGVQHDVPSALSIAHLMGVRDQNIQLLQNKELTLEGMENAFDELERRIQPGDKVFIYYSGHGGRRLIHDPDERCAESLITVKGNSFLDTELEARLKKLSGRAQKIIAMIDSCHSGGVTTRGLKKFTPKFWSRGGEESCEAPVNLVTRSISMASNTAGSGAKNYVYIAAAKNNEVSLDQPDKGGFATLAWAQCMAGEARDTDGSGGLTAEEIRVCAQQKIDAETKGIEGVLPQHISIVGNPDLVMTLASGKPEVQPSLPATPMPAPLLPAPAVPTAPLPNTAPTTTQAPVAAQPITLPVQSTQTGAPATLLDIYNGRDDKRIVTITPGKTTLKIGRDKFTVNIKSSHDGYLYLMMAGSDGKTFDLLFPNKLDGNNYIQAGETLQFPRANWEIIAQGPPGRDHILAIVADAPRDLAKLPMVNAGPFSIVNATSAGKRSIQLLSNSSSMAVQDECSNSGKRNLVVAQRCSDAYGAAITAVIEAD